ncbi:Glycoprotein gp2 [Candidatus Rhodobacter oscarellae]|uniref:Glycoprotein gp2 n=1 Tax=Candidatus Rhodobacter oscarellae TaxID=1675527 RepID=A0A0J9ECP9_9RHOB|nr:alpha/beta hydrolase [Candidatus Rhodobacter lobularis]KMW60557.1 Glycoprotein gp2 [Candidatus Rhodobacter lobularis]
MAALALNPDASVDAFARLIYGEVPPPPDSVEIERHLLPGARAERLCLTLRCGVERFTVDAALWLPDRPGSVPVPVILGLDFVGPAGILADEAFPLDPHARVHPRPDLGAAEGRLTDTLRGTAAHRWPIELLTAQGYAVMTSCYGSWTPDDPQGWQAHGVYPLIKSQLSHPTGAISLWAWALLRLVDVAHQLPQTSGAPVIAVGHSRLGKAALWAAEQDQRIAAVFANQSGCLGAAPAAHPAGETVAQLVERFPHWAVVDPQAATGLDQQDLLALLSPRRVYLAQGAEDLWADPAGSYQALRCAARAWPDATPGSWPDATPEVAFSDAALGFHQRQGGHDLLAYDWRQFLSFLRTT